MTTTQKHIDHAIALFIALAEVHSVKCDTLKFESKDWQYHRDMYVSHSNTAAQLMGEKDANPFI